VKIKERSRFFKGIVKAMTESGGNMKADEIFFILFFFFFLFGVPWGFYFLTGQYMRF
jgi:hypothetical protein